MSALDRASFNFRWRWGSAFLKDKTRWGLVSPVVGVIMALYRVEGTRSLTRSRLSPGWEHSAHHMMPGRSCQRTCPLWPAALVLERGGGGGQARGGPSGEARGWPAGGRGTRWGLLGTPRTRRRKGRFAGVGHEGCPVEVGGDGTQDPLGASAGGDDEEELGGARPPLFCFFELYSRFNVRNGTQPSIRVKCIDKRAWLSLALCEGCNHGGTSELALSSMNRVEESRVALARARVGAWLVA